MHSINCIALRHFLTKYGSNPTLRSLQDMLEDNLAMENRIDNLINIYKKSIPLIEKEVWENLPGELIVDRYQKMFQEMEELISLKGEDERYKFIIVIPVADRPQHLKSCLDSLLDLCKSYNYGGYSNNKYNKVSVIIADDSKEQGNKRRNKEISCYIDSQGIATLYFGLEDQLDELDLLTEEERDKLSRVLGNKKTSRFYHKGPSIMRNIAYLKLIEMATENEKILFYFIDSDQEFKVKVNTEYGDPDLLAINYFYQLDRIFTQSEANILTGKVVGDPPVSPSVMMGNFLDDIISYLHQAAETEHNKSCQFHKLERRKESDAAYHDMADLFGFTPSTKPYHYNCTLEGEHDNSECFKKFTSKLNRFFYGEHPTRRTYFNYEDVVDNLKAARTIYTGNYIFKPQALKYFIPFAALNLRMAGPVLGRIIKSEIQEQFVSANLPMLHRRTVQETGQSEFRLGVTNKKNTVDLSGEFERQFFGDVMLFTIERLADLGYPGRTFPQEFVEETLKTIEIRMYNLYAEKHMEIVERLKVLNSIVDSDQNWWNRLSGLEMAKDNVSRFMSNVERNFGARSICHDLISSEHNRKKRNQEIVEAIMTYTDDRRAWEDVLSKKRHGS